MKKTLEINTNLEQNAMQAMYDDLRNLEKKNVILKFIDKIKNKSSSKKVREEFLNSNFLNSER